MSLHSQIKFNKQNMTRLNLLLISCRFGQYSLIRSLNYSCCRPYAATSLKLLKRSLPFVQKADIKRYALKVYSQYTPEKASLSDKVFQYIKVKNDLYINDTTTLLNIRNVFDNSNAIEQLTSIVLHSLPPSPTDIVKLFSLYASFCNRSRLHQAFYVDGSSDTFKHKIESTITGMSFQELHQFSICLKSIMLLKIKYFQLLAEITFEESLTRAESSDSLSDIFKYFIIGLELYGNSINRKIGYKEFISLFEKHITSATPLQLTQILHFVGLNKKDTGIFSTKLPVVAARELSPYFDDLSFLDVGLAISGLFKIGFQPQKDDLLISKVGTKLTEMIETHNSPLLDNLESFALVSMIKYLRFSSYKNTEILKSMKLFLSQMDEQSFNPQLVCHILAFYANSNYYDSEVYALLANKFYHYLQSSDEVIRIKDISRVMWALSHAQHHCEEHLSSLVIKSLENFTLTGELLLHSSHVIDSTLALSTLKVYPEKLICTLLHPRILKNIRERERSRYLSRLLVLSEVQKSVLPDLSLPPLNIPREELPQRTISDECFHRPCIQLVGKALLWLRNECGAPVFSLKFLVPHIHYCSIVPAGTKIPTESSSEVGKRVLKSLSSVEGSLVCVDVDDTNTTLDVAEGEERKRVIGMEAMKREILRRRGWSVRVLSAREVQGCGEDVEALAALIVHTVVKDCPRL